MRSDNMKVTIWALLEPKLQQGAALVVCRNSCADCIYSVTVHHIPSPSLSCSSCHCDDAVSCTVKLNRNISLRFSASVWRRTELAAALFLSPIASCTPRILKTTLTWFFFFFHTIRDMFPLEMNRLESSRLQLPRLGVSGNVRTTMTKHFFLFPCSCSAALFEHYERWLWPLEEMNSIRGVISWNFNNKVDRNKTHVNKVEKINSNKVEIGKLTWRMEVDYSSKLTAGVFTTRPPKSKMVTHSFWWNCLLSAYPKRAFDLPINRPIEFHFQLCLCNPHDNLPIRIVSLEIVA